MKNVEQIIDIIRTPLLTSSIIEEIYQRDKNMYQVMMGEINPLSMHGFILKKSDGKDTSSETRDLIQNYDGWLLKLANANVLLLENQPTLPLKQARQLGRILHEAAEFALKHPAMIFDDLLNFTTAAYFSYQDKQWKQIRQSRYIYAPKVSSIFLMMLNYPRCDMQNDGRNMVGY